MKQFIFLFLLLNIYSIFSSDIYGQILVLEMEGKNTPETQILNNFNYKKNFTDYNSLKIEIDTTLSKLQRLGYIGAEITQITQKNDSLYQAVFHLHTQYTEMLIHFPADMMQYINLQNEIRIRSIETTDTYFIIPFSDTEEILSILNKRLTEEGDPFAFIQLSEIKPSEEKDSTLEAHLIITTSTKRKITGIEIKGYEKFSRPFLKYAVGIKEGMLFQRDKIIDKNTLLNNLGFVRTLKSPEILFTETETKVFLYLEKTNYNLFDGIIGFATNENTGNLELNGYLDLVLGNNLNYGEKFSVNYKNDGNKQQLFKTDLELPYLFQSPAGMDMGLQLFKRDSTFLTVDKYITGTYQLSTKTKIKAGYQDYESTGLQDEQPVGLDVVDYTSRFVLLGTQYVSLQDNPIFPVKTSAEITTQIGSRETSNSNTAQYKGNLTANHIFQLNYNNSLYVNNQTALLISEDYFVNELHRFGGINSIRGFEENSIDASFYSVLNTEYRFQLSSDTYLHSIIDIAYFENAVLQIKEQLYSFGIGMGLQTRSGIFRINIANGKIQNQEFKFSNTKIHLSLTSIF